MARSDGHHPVLCRCGRTTYRYGGRCWICAPGEAFEVRTAPANPARPKGRRPRLPHPSRLPADYLAACSEELANREAERIAMVARLRDLRSEAA